MLLNVRWWKKVGAPSWIEKLAAKIGKKLTRST